MAALTLSVAATASTMVSTRSAAHARAASGSGRCYATEKKINGKSVIVNCGPASIKLHFGGRTYLFKDGSCTKIDGSLTIDLGTTLEINSSNGNGGFTAASLTIITKSDPLQLEAYSGRMSLNGSAKFSGIAPTGSFSGTDASFGGVSTKGKQKPFRGTWNCGGPISDS